MKKDKTGIWVIALVITTVIVIIAALLIRRNLYSNDGEQMDISGYEDSGVTEAYHITDDVERYDVYVTVKGFGGDINSIVTIDAAAEKILKLEIVSHSESENYGAKVTESSFLKQFEGALLPIRYNEESGDSNDNKVDDADDTKNDMDQNGNEDNNYDTSLQDGTYYAQASEYHNGYISEVTMVVRDSKICDVIWECTDEDGNTKRMLSQNGQYSMTVDGLIWADQADNLAKYVIDNQGIDGLTIDDDGKTDMVSGVSISVDEFINLVSTCIEQAKSSSDGENQNIDNTDNTNAITSTTEKKGTVIDGISGATYTTKAIVKAIDAAYEYICDVVDK